MGRAFAEGSVKIYETQLQRNGRIKHEIGGLNKILKQDDKTKFSSKLLKRNMKRGCQGKTWKQMKNLVIKTKRNKAKQRSGKLEENVEQIQKSSN